MQREHDSRHNAATIGAQAAWVEQEGKGMARTVTIIISYDMDDEEKSLSEELRDWVEGNVNVMDLFTEALPEGKEAMSSLDNSLIRIQAETP